MVPEAARAKNSEYLPLLRMCPPGRYTVKNGELVEFIHECEHKYDPNDDAAWHDYFIVGKRGHIERVTMYQFRGFTIETKRQIIWAP